jgi:PKD repeat protein
MKKRILLASGTLILAGILFFLVTGFMKPADPNNPKATTGGLLTFTVRTVAAGGNYAPKHVLAIWIEKDGAFVKSRKVMATVRKQYLYTWVASSNYNTTDAITGATLTSHQTHTITWNCKDLNGNIVPDGDYTVWAEFTDKHAQGPVTHYTFTKGPNSMHLTPPDETYFKDLVVDFTPCVADFTADNTTICQNGQVTFTDLSTNATSWSWDFGEGASPATASTQGPHTVTYSTPGAKNVSLTINGEVTETKTAYVAVQVSPTAGYTYSASGLTVDFTNTSANATSYEWDFGDGQTSTDPDPSHTYAAGGTYAVQLIATYLNCYDIQVQNVTVTLTGIAGQLAEQGYSIFPNPSEGKFFLSYSANPGESFILNIYDMNGRQVLTRELHAQTETGSLPVELDRVQGVYLAEIVRDDKAIFFKLIIR